VSAVYRSPVGERAVLGRYRELLNRWPVPAEHRRVPTSEGETFVVVCGPAGAPPVVLLHGSSTNTAMWLGDVPHWAPHLRLYAVDMVGEPGLSAQSRPALGSDAPARWLGDVLDGLGLERAALVGASLGGWFAVDFATRHPERVERLTLLCPGGLGRQKVAALLPALLLRPFGARGRRAAMRYALGPGLPGDAAEFLDYMALVQRHFRPRLEPLPIVGDDALRRLTMPVLAVVGERDRLLDSHGTRRRLRHAVPHARVDVLPGTGHAIIGRSLPILDFLREPKGTQPHV
jgi:pimeloyl-ACP methyl ester carboxylesterase